MSDMIKLKALAKINLGLDVLGRRENGILTQAKNAKKEMTKSA